MKSKMRLRKDAVPNIFPWEPTEPSCSEVEEPSCSGINAVPDCPLEESDSGSNESDSGSNEVEDESYIQPIVTEVKFYYKHVPYHPTCN